MNAVDTNLLFYSIDRSEPEKQSKAQKCLQGLRSSPATTWLLWQVLGESAQQLRRWRDQGKLSSAECADHLAAFRYIFPLLLPTPASFDLAVSLADRFSLAHWDSMILGACKSAGITTLYTEDMGAPRTLDGIERINPLR
jgi:predicted nucleic acid-binding protein